MKRKIGSLIKGCVRFVYASLFFMSRREHLRSKEKLFYFTLKAHFVLEIFNFSNSNFNFSNIKCHDVIKCLSMRHSTRIIEVNTVW